MFFFSHALLSTFSLPQLIRITIPYILNTYCSPYREFVCYKLRYEQKKKRGVGMLGRVENSFNSCLPKIGIIPKLCRLFALLFMIGRC